MCRRVRADAGSNSATGMRALKRRGITAPLLKIQQGMLDKFKSDPSAKVIAFDIDNTLFNTREFAELARRNAIREMMRQGIRGLNENQLYKLLIQIVKLKTSNYEHHFDDLCDAIVIPDRLKARYVSAAIMGYNNTKLSINLFPDVESTLQILYNQNHLLLSITEGIDIKQWDKIHRLGISRFLYDVFVTRHKTVDIYLSVIAHLSEVGVNMNSRQFIMVGDSLEKDVRSAAQAGFLTMYVDRYNEKGYVPDADLIISNFDDLSHRISFTLPQIESEKYSTDT